jgi:hypothetical protein
MQRAGDKKAARPEAKHAPILVADAESGGLSSAQRGPQSRSQQQPSSNPKESEAARQSRKGKKHPKQQMNVTPSVAEDPAPVKRSVEDLRLSHGHKPTVYSRIEDDSDDRLLEIIGASFQATLRKNSTGRADTRPTSSSSAKSNPIIFDESRGSAVSTKRKHSQLSPFEDAGNKKAKFSNETTQQRIVYVLD